MSLTCHNWLALLVYYLEVRNLDCDCDVTSQHLANRSGNYYRRLTGWVTVVVVVNVDVVVLTAVVVDVNVVVDGADVHAVSPIIDNAAIKINKVLFILNLFTFIRNRASS